MTNSEHRLLRASAGTGKTYQLVQAYIGHVRDGGLSPANVVAITFTRKAAAELRSRIRNGLIERPSTGVVSLRAELDALSRAPIANFHGLALQMLQGFGVEVGFTDVPTIMGDLGEDERLFRIACEEAWFGKRAAVQEALAAVSMRMRLGARGRGMSFVDAVWRAIAAAREDDDPRPLAARFATYDARAAQAEVHGRCSAFHKKLAAGVMSLGGKARDKTMAFLAHREPTLGDDLGAWTMGWRAAFDELKGAQLKGISEAAERNELIATLETPFTEGICAQLAPHMAVLVQSACDRYSELKRETRSADFADLLERTSAALEADKALHARVRERFKVVLVDEAQDTNASQRRFVRLIAGLDGPARDSKPAALFVVGDKKQAIYTFRGADPRSFAQFENDLTSLGVAIEDLTVSRRSSAAVVRGVNHLGSAMLEPYEALEPLAGRLDDGAPALTWLVPDCEDTASTLARAEAEARAVAKVVRGAVDAGSDPSRFAILLRATGKAQTFARALATLGLPSVITGGGGFYAQSEIVDLIALLAWLADADASFDAAVAMRSPLIGFSDSALLHLFGAGDRSRLTALRRGDASGFVSTSAADQATAQALAAALPGLIAAVTTLGAGRVVGQVLDALDVRAVLLALPFGEQKLANIERFVELAWNHERTSGRGTAHFTHEQRDHARRGATEPLRAIGAARERAVAIMTVHQAKGLEFDHVLIADISQERQGDGASIAHARDIGFVFAPERRPGVDPVSVSGKTLRSDAYRRAEQQRRDDQEAEMRRLLYVAATRAREKLTFVCTDGARATGFGRVLIKWAPAAIEAGVMQRVAERALGEVVAPPPASVPASKSAEVKESKAARRPAVVRGGQLELFGGAEGRWPSTDGRAPSTDGRWPSADGRWLSTDGRAPSTDGRAPSADGRMPTADDRAPTAAFVTRAPVGTRFALSVTDLENFRDAKADSERRAWAWRVNGGGAAKLADPDLALDPLARGRLSHMVLAAMHRVGRHPSLEHFIDAELRTCAYEPTDPRLATIRDDLLVFLTSTLGRAVTQLSADARRHEMPFVLPFTVGDYSVTVTGQIDLVYWDGDGPVIVDYKHAHAASTPVEAHAAQLDAYALALAELCGIDAPIRTRLVFLRDRARVRDRVVTASMRDDLRRLVDEVARALVIFPPERRELSPQILDGVS